MKAALIVIVVLLVVALLFGASLISTRNRLVTERNAIESQWHQVDVVLQRRADLIPNLVETVKGYAKHEEVAIDAVANARAALGGAKTPRTASRRTTSSTEHSADCWWWWRTTRT